MADNSQAASLTASEIRTGRPALVPIAGLLGLVLIWGLSIPVTKIGLQDMPPLVLTAARYLVAAPCFALFLIGKPVPPPRILAALAGLGMLGIGVGQTAQAFGIRGTSASAGTIISATIPVFMVVFATWRLRQPVRFRHALGLGVALCGIGILAMGEPSHVATGSLPGDAAVLLSAITIALYYVLGAELTPSHGVAAVGAWSSLFGAVGLLPLAAWEWSAHPAQVTAAGLTAVAYLGLLVTVAGLWIWLTALRRVPVRIAASMQYLQPLIGVGASALWFGDSIGGGFTAGAALVLTGIALAS